MLLTQTSEFQLFKLHKAFRDAQRRARFARVFTRARSLDPRKELAGRAEHEARAILEGMGYQVARCGYNCGWDLWVEGARVEVKAATYSGGRYQAAIRNHDADLVLFACQTATGDLEWFVIPGEALGSIGNLAVWTADPSAHQGKWCDYYAAWWWVDAITQRVPSHRGWQVELPLQEAGGD